MKYFSMTLRAGMLWLLLATSAMYAQEIAIDGPTELAVKEADLYEVSGGTSKAYEWHVFPKGGTKIRRVFMDRGFDKNGSPVFGPGVMFKSTLAGIYELVFVDFDSRAVVTHTIYVGSGPNPPPPPPPPEPTAVFGIIIEERDDRDDIGIQRAMVMESLAVRKLFPAGAFQCRDDDVLDEGGKGPPPDIKPYIDRARKLGLPAIFLVNKNGKVLFEGPVPKDVPATVKLIGRYIQ